MRFEIEVVELGTALLTDNGDAFEAIKESIMAQVEELPLTVNIVAREKSFIEQVNETGWWASPTEDDLQTLVDRLGPLMKYRTKRAPAMVHLDIEDALQVKETVEFGPEKERISTKAYRERVEAYIRALVNDNAVLQKIRQGLDVTDSEVMELAELLRSQDPYVTEELLRKVYDHKTARFIQFMRHILGLEMLESWPETVTMAFNQFISDHTDLTSLQIRFIMTLRTFIIQTGKVEKRNLIEAPFTQIHPKGIRGVFTPVEIQEVIQFAGSLTA
jgi:type I restriction enzyme R subunit